MLKNYLFIAWRNLARRKVYTTINISGLAIGIAACLLLFSIIKYELSYESFQPNRNRIYHVVTQDKTPNGLFFTPGIPYPALEAIRTDIPQVTTGCLYASYGSQVTVLGNKDPQSGIDKKFIEDNGFFFADPQFFQIFHVDWLSGSPGVLKEPNTTVLTQEVAEKYFGNWKSAVGQLLKLDNSITVKVAGVLKDLPLNTDFPLKVVNSFETLKANMETYGFSPEWGSTTSNFQIFLLLPNGSSEAEINRQLAVFSKRQYATRERSVRTNFLQPLSEVHFDSRFGNLGDHTISKSSLWTLALIGIFIIIMASINFINLSTAQAVGRSKEVGIRKVLGSNRKQLFWQVIGETGIIVFVAVLLAIGMAILCLPYLKHIASIQERLSIFNWPALGFIILVAILVTFGAGFYPSLVLSGFNPALALKNKITSASMGGISLRRGLVVLQFAISQVLIIGTIIAVSQMKFVQQADLGFNKEALMIISSNSDSIITAHQPAFKEKLLQIPGIQSVSFSSDVPSSDNNWATNFAYDHKDDETFSLYLKFGDEDYVKTYGLQLLAGRNISKSDTTKEILVNETLMKKLGVHDPKEMIGKEIRTGRSAWRSIVGVVRDFKTNSLREDVKPTMIGERRKFYSRTGIKLRTSNLAQMQSRIQNAWNEFYPEYAFTSSFMDDDINNFYRQEQQMSLLYKLFAGIAIFISCLGLYGLVSFMVTQKTKEVGVRKVLGASVANILYLFSKEFTVLILLAFLIAVPVAWFLMSHWLEDFVFRINIGVGVFLLAVVSSVVIAWITVGYKSVKAALSNPIKSLRTE